MHQLHRGGFSGWMCVSMCMCSCVRACVCAFMRARVCACVCVSAYHNLPSLHVFPSSFKPIPVGHAQENRDCVELALEGRQKWLQP